MVQSQTVGDSPSAIVADQREGRKAELDHQVDQLLRHRALRIRNVIIGGAGDTAAPVGSQIYTDHRVVLGEHGREEPPHQTRPRKAVDHENGRPAAVAPHEHHVARHVDAGGLEGAPRCDCLCSCGTSQGAA